MYKISKIQKLFLENKKIIIFLGLLLFCFPLMAAETSESFFDFLTGMMFNFAIKSFKIEPGQLNGLQYWILGICLVWEMMVIILAVAGGATDVVKKILEFGIYTSISFCFLGIVSYTDFFGGALLGNGGRYEGKYLDIDIYNFINKKARTFAGEIEDQKATKDISSTMEGVFQVNAYCRLQSDTGNCIAKAFKKLKPDINNKNAIDSFYAEDLRHYVAVHSGCEANDGILEKDLLDEKYESQGNFKHEENKESSTGLAYITSKLKCSSFKLSQVASYVEPSALAGIMGFVFCTLLNFIASVFINIILFGNLLELLFMLIFSRFIYPFIIVTSQRSKIFGFIKDFASLALIPLLMKLGLWATDALLQGVIDMLFGDPIGFVLRAFPGGFSSLTDIASASGMAIVMSLAMLAFPVIVLSILVIKIVVLMKLTGMTKDLFNLQFNKLQGIGRESISMFPKVAGTLAAVVATGGAALATGGAVLGAASMGAKGALGAAVTGAKGYLSGGVGRLAGSALGKIRNLSGFGGGGDGGGSLSLDAKDSARRSSGSADTKTSKVTTDTIEVKNQDSGSGGQAATTPAIDSDALKKANEDQQKTLLSRKPGAYIYVSKSKREKDRTKTVEMNDISDTPKADDGWEIDDDRTLKSFPYPKTNKPVFKGSDTPNADRKAHFDKLLSDVKISDQPEDADVEKFTELRVGPNGILPNKEQPKTNNNEGVEKNSSVSINNTKEIADILAQAIVQALKISNPQSYPNSENPTSGLTTNPSASGGKGESDENEKELNDKKIAKVKELEEEISEKENRGEGESFWKKTVSDFMTRRTSLENQMNKLAAIAKGGAALFSGDFSAVDGIKESVSNYQQISKESDSISFETAIKEAANFEKIEELKEYVAARKSLEYIAKRRGLDLKELERRFFKKYKSLEADFQSATEQVQKYKNSFLNDKKLEQPIKTGKD